MLLEQKNGLFVFIFYGQKPFHKNYIYRANKLSLNVFGLPET